MISLSREAIQRMINADGGNVGGGGGGDISALLAGYATETWVDENYLSIEFFSKLFKAYNSANPAVEIKPNDTQSTITNIKAMFGFWTEQYLSALGQNSGGGGGGATVLSDLNDVAISSLANDDVLVYNSSASHWVNTPKSTFLSGYLTGITSSMVITALGYTPANNADLANYLPLTGGNVLGSKGDAVLQVANIYNTQITTMRCSYGQGYGMFIGSSDTTSTYYLLYCASGITNAAGSGGTLKFIIRNNGNVGIGVENPSYLLHVNGNAYASSFIKSGGTSSQFLKADGSVDSNSYLTTTGNAASATKLQTARYIFGLSFDGTQDIPKTSVPTMRYIWFSDTDTTGLAGYVGRGASTNNNIQLTAYAGNSVGIGANSTDNVLFINTSLNVGIGTTTPSYKLHVVGDIYSSNKVTAQNSVQIGDAVLVWDSTNNALKVVKYSGSTEVAVNLYATGGVSALGYGASGGGGGATVLSDLNDVSISSLSNNDVLVYNSSTSHWENMAKSTFLNDYLPLTGGTLNSGGSQTDLFIKQTSSMLQMACASGQNYIESYGSTNTSNATLNITGYSANIGSTLNIKFNEINITSKRGDWSIIDTNTHPTSNTSVTVGLAHSSGYGIAVETGVSDNVTYLMRLRSGSSLTDRFYVGTNGKVGIGTNNPSALLDVLGNARFSSGYYSNTNPTLGALNVNTVAIVPINTSLTRAGYGMYFWVDWSHGTGRIQCGYEDGSTNALGLALNPLGGAVGIGYTGDVRTLGYTLAVNGTINAATNIYVNGNAVLTDRGYIGTTAVQASSATQAVTGLSSIKFANASSYLYNSSGETIFNTNTGNIVLGYDMSKANYHTYIDGNEINFRTNTTHTEVLRLTNTGRVLIGDYNTSISRLVVQALSSEWAFTAKGTNAAFSAGHDSGYGMAVGSTLSSDSIYLLDVVKGKTTPTTGGTSVFTIYGSGRIEQNGYITFGDNTYFRGSPSFGFRFNDHNSNYNNLIIRENGTVYIRSGLSINRTDINSYCKLDVNGQARCTYMYFKNYNDDGLAGYVGRSSGSNNNIQFTAYAGNGVGIGANSTDNVLFINTSLNVGIGTLSPSYKLHVVGDIYASSAGFINQGIELNYGRYTQNFGGYIDFHFDGYKTNRDYSIRISETSENILSIDGKHLSGSSYVGYRACLSVGKGYDNSYIDIGGARLVWQASNKALRVTTSGTSGEAVSIYATGGVSALGMDNISATGSVGATLVPSTTATYDLGSSDYKWGNIYLSKNGTNTSIVNTANFTYFGTSKYFSFSGNIFLENYGLYIGSLYSSVNRNYDLYVDGENGGNAYFVDGIWADSFNRNSDMRLKNVLSDLTLDVTSVANAPLFLYTMKNGKQNVRVGTSAQYWDIVLPQTVTRDADGMLSLDYSIAAFASVVSVAKQVSEHDRRIAKLEAENAMLRAEINDLKAA